MRATSRFCIDLQRTNATFSISCSFGMEIQCTNTRRAVDAIERDRNKYEKMKMEEEIHLTTYWPNGDRPRIQVPTFFPVLNSLHFEINFNVIQSYRRLLINNKKSIRWPTVRCGTAECVTHLYFKSPTRVCTVQRIQSNDGNFSNPPIDIPFRSFSINDTQIDNEKLFSMENVLARHTCGCDWISFVLGRNAFCILLSSLSSTLTDIPIGVFLVDVEMTCVNVWAKKSKVFFSFFF